MPTPPLRIAILECDTPFPQAQKVYGSFGGVWTSLFESAITTRERTLVSSLKPEDLQTSNFDVVTKQEYPNLDDVDGIVITGSKHNSYDNDPWILKLVEFVKTIFAQERVRLIGVCFGHQIVGRVLGAKVGPSEKGWEISVTPIKLTETGNRLYELDVLNIFQMHKDIVHTLPKGVENLGHTQHCAIQGMFKKNKFLTMQGHPEYNGTIVSEVLQIRKEKGIFNETMYDDAKSRVFDNHDGIHVGGEFLRFFLEE